MPTLRRPRQPPGFALLIVLWSVVLLALLATQITAAGRGELQLARNVAEAAEAEGAADAGVAMAIFHVLDAGSAWAADDLPHAERFGRFPLSIQVADENARVNPNLAPDDLLAALLGAEGTDPARAREIAAAIVAWRFPGGGPLKLAQYRAAGHAFGPTGQAFRSVAELGLVLGMNPALQARMAPHLSVYADGGLNYAQADPVLQGVMRALSGGAPPPPRNPGPPTVATITAVATDTRGGRFTRRATVAFAHDPAGRLFRVLDWHAGAAP